MKTTLKNLYKHHPHTESWGKLLAHLGKVLPDDEPILISTILKVNGLDEALWSLRAVEGHGKELLLLALEFIKPIRHLIKNRAISDALDVAEKFANGEATEVELEAATIRATHHRGSFYGVDDAAADILAGLRYGLYTTPFVVRMHAVDSGATRKAQEAALLKLCKEIEAKEVGE